jgi:hypothetical protein
MLELVLVLSQFTMRIKHKTGQLNETNLTLKEIEEKLQGLKL